MLHTKGLNSNDFKLKRECLFLVWNNILTNDDKTKLMCLSGVKQYPMRVKCATLAWHTLTSAMDNKKEETNTEKFD